LNLKADELKLKGKFKGEYITANVEPYLKQRSAEMDDKVKSRAEELKTEIP
jgi:hypothetical protein